MEKTLEVEVFTQENIDWAIIEGAAININQKFSRTFESGQTIKIDFDQEMYFGWIRDSNASFHLKEE